MRQFAHVLKLPLPPGTVTDQERNLLQAVLRRRSDGPPIVRAQEGPSATSHQYMQAQFDQESLARILADLERLVPSILSQVQVQQIRVRPKNGQAEEACTCVLSGAKGSVPDFSGARECRRHYDPSLDPQVRQYHFQKGFS